MFKNKNLRVITFLSAKGGVGKSSLIVNLSYLLKKKNLETLIIDTNFTFPNIDIFLGENTGLKILKNSVVEDKNILELIRNSKKGIKYISLPLPEKPFNRQIIKSIRENIFNLDFIFIDTPVGINENSLFLATHSEKVIIITTTEIASLSNTYILLNLLSRKTAILPEILINKAESKREAIETYEDLKRTVKNFLKMEIKFLGYTLKDKNFENAVKEGNIPLENSFTPYIQSLKGITEKLNKENGYIKGVREDEHIN